MQNKIVTDTFNLLPGRPEPNVTWRLGTSPLNKTFQSYSNNVTFSKVTLPPITRDFWSQNIRCEARSTNLTKLISSSVKLDLILPPKEVKIQGSLHPFREGKPLKLFCVTKGSQPLANITWWKNGTLMKNFKIKFADNFTGSTLYLTPRREDDMAFMKCRAKNPQLPKEIVEDRFRLRVQYPPRIRIQPGTRVDISGIKEGDDIYFECIVEANPMVNIIEWYLNGDRLYQNVSSGIIVSGRSLVVQGITRHFSGKYHCRGKNILASAVSKTIKLNVKFLPECKQGQQTTYGGARNETLNITCDVTGQPLPTRFFWSYNASSEIIDLSHIKSKNNPGRSTLFYKPKRNSDFGALLCWAKNDVGRQKIPCVYQVVPASNPESVKNCSVTGNPSSVDIIVECEPGWNGGLHQSFLLQVRKSHLGPILATIRNQDKPKFFVDDLKAGNEFLLTVLARNSRGFSIATNIAHFVPIDIAEERLSAATVSTRKEDKQSLGGFLLAIIVGTLVVLSIIATAAFFFVRSRNFANRPRRQNLSTTSGDGPSTENLEKETDEEEREFINQEQEEVLIPAEGDMTKRVPPQRKGAHAPKKRRSKFVSEEQLLPPKEGESLEDQRIPSQNENDSPILKEDTSSFSQPETAFPLFSHSSVLNTQILSSHHTTQPSSGHSNLLQNDLIADVSPTLPSPHEDERHIVSGLPSSVNGEQTTQALCETSYIRRKLRGFTKNSGDRESFV